MTRRPIDPRVSPAPLAEDDSGSVLREAFAHWASGVAVLSARDDDGRVYAMTIAAFTPVSVDPPLALVCIHNDAPLASVLDDGVACALSLLTEGQKRAATTFADRFAVPGDLLTDEALPAVAGADATLRGRVRAVHDGGDHRIVVLEVMEAGSDPAGLPPLVYWRRGYRRLADAEA